MNIDSVVTAAGRHGIQHWGVADRDDGSTALLFRYDHNDTAAVYFTTGYCQTLEQAAQFTIDIFESHTTEEIMVNIFKSEKLFPNIRGVMLKEKRVTLHMNGKAKVVEMREGNDARVEIFFTDHAKSAVVNRTQAMLIADVYGPETDEWKGKPLALFGEFGSWFGKETWGLRVDKDETLKAWNKEKRNGHKAEAAPDSEPETAPMPEGEIPFDLGDDEREQTALEM